MSDKLVKSQWRKSTYSSGNGADNCVEVAHSLPATVPVRDSKDPGGPVLAFPRTAWVAFIAGLKAGDFPPIV
jgi:Domain of unknown function (DUF397)